ncbi:8717_t:CDS:2, partial [Racocetra fulgida]
MAAIFLRTRFTTCIPPQYGGSGNPSSPTARGVVRALEAAFSHLGKSSLQGVTVAVQGVGHVATAYIHYLVERQVGHIIACDVDSQKIKAAEKTFSKEIKDGTVSFRLAKDVDAVSPCGIGGILNTETIPNIKAKIICGAANNQLQGIVNCADEASGYVEDDPMFEKHLGDTWENSIYNLTKFVLSAAEKSSRTTQEVAIELAEKRSFVKHPIFGHRGIQIINSLVNSK